MQDLARETDEQIHGDRKGSADPSPLHLARAAIALSERYETPPVPRTFELWYAYAAGESDKLRADVDGTLRKSGGLSNYEVEQIYQSHLADNNDEGHISQEVAREMKTATGLIRRQICYNDHHAGTLTKSSHAMATTRDVEQMRRTIDALMHENGQMRAATVKLSRHLEQTRDRLGQLNAKLEASRLNEMKDELTGVWNRRGFERAIARLFGEARKTGEPLALVMADIDHFKKLNDTHGHQVGDDVLRFVAQLFCQNVKGRDMVTRYGGEEFAILLPTTTLANARNLTAQFIEALANARMVTTRGKQSIGSITCSFGITETTGDEGRDKVIGRADKALYAAKAGGRNRAVTEPAS